MVLPTCHQQKTSNFQDSVCVSANTTVHIETTVTENSHTKAGLLRWFSIFFVQNTPPRSYVPDRTSPPGTVVDDSHPPSTYTNILEGTQVGLPGRTGPLHPAQADGPKHASLGPSWARSPHRRSASPQGPARPYLLSSHKPASEPGSGPAGTRGSP